MLVLLGLLGCGGDSGTGWLTYAGFNPGPTPPELHRGEVLYNTYCSSCHGVRATGQGLGPPLLDTLYRPGLLPDSAIARAIAQGTRQQHWNFGAMPPVGRVAGDEVPLIVDYVRWLQVRAGETLTAPASERN